MVVAKIEEMAVVTEFGLCACHAATSLIKKNVGKKTKGGTTAQAAEKHS